MDFIESLVLGVIQGLTEFLPVSSSGHLELGKVIFDQDLSASESLLFTIVVHAATALSTIVVFRNDIRTIFRELLTFRWTDSTNLVLFIIVSMIPAALVGFFWKDELESLFTGDLMLVGLMLMVTATLLLITSFLKPKRGIINYWKSLVIGVAQAIAILPGISRSGSTIAVGLMLGINRSKMARFSFLMVLPLIFGAMAKDLMDYDSAKEASIETGNLVVAFIAAFATGILACNWMIKLVRKSKLSYFAIYCFIVGGIAIAYSLV